MKTHKKRKNSGIKWMTMLLLFAGFGFNSDLAQGQFYRTATGRLIIKADLNDVSVTIESKDLLIQLDYETGNVVIRQEISAMKADNDSIQSMIKNNENGFLKFIGKLGLDYVNTTDHAPLDFGVEGTLFPQNIHVIGTGHLEHIAQRTTSACLLSLEFVLEPGVLFPENQIPGLHKNLHIKVIQSLLATGGE